MTGVAGAPLETEQSTLLSIKDLRITFRERVGIGRSRDLHAVDGVTFELLEGETLALVGESGSGKTTIGLTIMGQYAPSAGQVEFAGKQVAQLNGRDLKAFRREVQMIFQDPYSSLDPRMRVLDIVAEPVLAHGLIPDPGERREFIVGLLERCGLPSAVVERFPDALSGGQRQRVAIARALTLHPRLVVADEPTSALDVSVQAQVLELMRSLQVESDVSYLFISHNLAIVRQVAHRVVVLLRGKVMEIGPVEDVYTNPIHPYTQELLDAVPVPDPTTAFRFRHIAANRSDKAPIPGCVFRNRCPLATEKCEESPPLQLMGDGRWAACWYAEASKRGERSAVAYDESI